MEKGGGVYKVRVEWLKPQGLTLLGEVLSMKLRKYKFCHHGERKEGGGGGGGII